MVLNYYFSYKVNNSSYIILSVILIWFSRCLFDEMLFIINHLCQGYGFNIYVSVSIKISYINLKVSTIDFRKFQLSRRIKDDHMLY